MPPPPAGRPGASASPPASGAAPACASRTSSRLRLEGEHHRGGRIGQLHAELARGDRLDPLVGGPGALLQLQLRPLLVELLRRRLPALQLDEALARLVLRRD